VITDQIRWDAEMFRIYGRAPTEDGTVPYSVWSDAVVPEDLEQQEAILDDTVRQRGRSAREFRIRRQDTKEERRIASVETARLNTEGQSEWMVGPTSTLPSGEKARRR
jgi:hypothetical protein